jgi:hypothetical protein
MHHLIHPCPVCRFLSSPPFQLFIITCRSTPLLSSITSLLVSSLLLLLLIHYRRICWAISQARHHWTSLMPYHHLSSSITLVEIILPSYYHNQSLASFLFLYHSYKPSPTVRDYCPVSQTLSLDMLMDHAFNSKPSSIWVMECT